MESIRPSGGSVTGRKVFLPVATFRMLSVSEHQPPEATALPSGRNATA
jgi:hypothetical protein